VEQEVEQRNDKWNEPGASGPPRWNDEAPKWNNGRALVPPLVTLVPGEITPKTGKFSYFQIIIITIILLFYIVEQKEQKEQGIY
jgi:hypothetical protein